MLQSKTHMSRSAIYQARAQLRTLGRIDYRERTGNLSTLYTIHVFEAAGVSGAVDGDPSGAESGGACNPAGEAGSVTCDAAHVAGPAPGDASGTVSTDVSKDASEMDRVSDPVSSLVSNLVSSAVSRDASKKVSLSSIVSSIVSQVVSAVVSQIQDLLSLHTPVDDNKYNNKYNNKFKTTLSSSAADGAQAQEAAAGERGSDLELVCRAYAEHLCQEPSAPVRASLGRYLAKGLEPKVVVQALRRSCGAKAPWKYATSILDGWMGSGICSESQVEQADARYRASRREWSGKDTPALHSSIDLDELRAWLDGAGAGGGVLCHA